MKGAAHFGSKIGAAKPNVGKGSISKIHPAANFGGQTRVRLPDTGSIGADPSPIVPNVGKI